MIVYISGKYSKGDISENIANARRVAIELWEKGYTVICPHLNTQHFEVDCNIPYESYIYGDMEILARCDAILMLPQWEESDGATQEKERAVLLGMPVYIYPDLPLPSPTEKKYPQQCAGFMALVMKMYRVMLAKNADYSGMNILGTGEIGVATRIWDKVARLLNLIGFDIKAEFQSFNGEKQAKNESVQDTYEDLSVYGIIGILLKAGIWGK